VRRLPEIWIALGVINLAAAVLPNDGVSDTKWLRLRGDAGR
jgi:hypothetical protein